MDYDEEAMSWFLEKDIFTCIFLELQAPQAKSKLSESTVKYKMYQLVLSDTILSQGECKMEETCVFAAQEGINIAT